MASGDVKVKIKMKAPRAMADRLLREAVRAMARRGMKGRSGKKRG